MWILCTLLTFICWGVADLFYKKGNNDKGNYQHLKTGLFVGVVMGIHATLYLLFTKVDINFIDIIKYLPVSLLYISSMVIGYKGLKYLELSIASPIQNTSGVITALLLLLFFKETLVGWAYVAFVLIFVGIILLSIFELNDTKIERVEYRKNNKLSKVFFLTILFPIGYCILDGLGTFLDGIYLDKLGLISEDVALVAYEYTFLIYAVIVYIFLKYKKEKVILLNEKDKIFASIFETVGQFFYVFAMAGNAVISAPIIGSYCILSMLLSRVFLKETLQKKEYFAIILVLIGILILSIFDI